MADDVVTLSGTVTVPRREIGGDCPQAGTAAAIPNVIRKASRRIVCLAFVDVTTRSAIMIVR